MDLDVDWEPGIGDPSFMGWLTVAAYLGAAVLCALAARAIRRHVPVAERGRQVAVWRAMAALFVALGVNKQLDLQSWFTAFGRAVLAREGWAEHKATLQVAFIVASLAAAVVVVAVALWAAKRKRREYGLLVVGVVLTVTFVLVRATSFHHVDRLIGFTVGGVRMNWVLELSGIGLVGLAAWLRRRHAETGTCAGG